MSTKTLEKMVKNLSQEVATLRSIVISVVREEKDPEGEYRPEFVKDVLKAVKEPAKYKFTGRKDFLKQLRAR